MTLRYNVLMRDAKLNAITTFAGTSALLRIYDGSQLAELTCNASQFAGASSSAVLTLSAITSDSSANATGTATWFRIVKSDGTTHVMDGTVGTSGADLNLNTVSIVSGATVAVSSFTITAGNA
jgi:hypothetical protein